MGSKGRKDKKSDIPTGFDKLHNKYGEYIMVELTDYMMILLTIASYLFMGAPNGLYDGIIDSFGDIWCSLLSSVCKDLPLILCTGKQFEEYFSMNEYDKDDRVAPKGFGSTGRPKR